MRVHLRFDSVSVDSLRDLLAAASRHRDGFPDYNHNGMPGAPVWAPLVTVEGPACFTVIFPPCDPFTALAITGEGSPIPAKADR